MIMNRITPRLSFASAIAATTLLFAAPAFAQSAEPAPTPTGPQGTERINQVIVYGDDACPSSANGDIVVCARMGEDERYRIPPDLRGNPNDLQRESWTARVLAVERTGRFGTDSCSPAGLGGFTGCMLQTIDNAYAERQQAAGTDWTNAVAEQRRLRMEGFDADAREVEAQIARDEAARIAREQAAEDAAIADEAGPLPTPAGPTPPALATPTPQG